MDRLSIRLKFETLLWLDQTKDYNLVFESHKSQILTPGQDPLNKM